MRTPVDGRRAYRLCLLAVHYVATCVNRPHNSGHYTYEACECDQFKNHLRAVLGLPLGGVDLRVGAAMMVNVLGESDDPEQVKAYMRPALSIPGAALHWYGKQGNRKGRKMAHMTFTASGLDELLHRVRARQVQCTCAAAVRNETR